MEPTRIITELKDIQKGLAMAYLHCSDVLKKYLAETKKTNTKQTKIHTTLPKGIYERGNKFVARVWKKGRNVQIGTFNSITAAKRARNKELSQLS